MSRIGITGGAASGKSSFARLLGAELDCRLVSADEIVARLLTTDPEVRDAVAGDFGESALGPDGFPSRERLRTLVFNDISRKVQLERILHPRVRRIWLDLSDSHAGPVAPPIILEIPLLFETDAATHFDLIVTVACSRHLQSERMQKYRNLSASMAGSILDSQFTNDQRIPGSTYVIWNDGSMAALHAHVPLVAHSIRNASCQNP